VRPRRLLTLAGVAVGLALLVVGGALLRPFVWPENPDAGAQMVNGRLVSEAMGYVAVVDSDERILKISASILGLRPVTLSVGDDATIMIGDKQGGLGDLAVDMPVRVAYALDGGTRRAIAVERLAAGTSVRASSIAPDSARANSVTNVELPPRPAAVVRPQPVARPAPTPVLQPIQQPAPQPKLARPPAIESTAVSTRTATERPRAERPTTPQAAPAPKPADPARSVSAPRPTVERAAEEGGADGSAAIDWLLKSRGR